MVHNPDIKKKAFVKAYQQSFGNITESCDAVDISRRTYYNWIQLDAAFKAEVEAIEPNELLVDFAETALMRRIKADDTTAIIFTLKTRGKNRGYVERQEFKDVSEKAPSWFTANPITTLKNQERES